MVGALRVEKGGVSFAIHSTEKSLSGSLRSAGGGKGLRHAYGHQQDFHNLAVINALMAHLRLVLVKHVNRGQRFRPGPGSTIHTLKLHEWKSELPESQIANLDLWSFACDSELLLDLRLH